MKITRSTGTSNEPSKIEREEEGSCGKMAVEGSLNNDTSGKQMNQRTMLSDPSGEIEKLSQQNLNKIYKKLEIRIFIKLKN